MFEASLLFYLFSQTCLLYGLTNSLKYRSTHLKSSIFYRPRSPQTIKAAVTGQKGTDVETIDVLMSRLKAKGDQPSGKVQPKKKGPQEGNAVSSKKKKPLFAAGGAEGGDPLSR